jgi:hypothetical protein
LPISHREKWANTDTFELPDETRERLCFSSIAKSDPKAKKADVAEHPEVFDHVGLLVNEPPGTAGLPFI